MKKVKYINSNSSVTRVSNFTHGKVYDVVNYIQGTYSWITIINDFDDEFTYNDPSDLFTDVTAEYRDEVINNILL